MSMRCDFCHRGPYKKTDRSHSNIASKRWVYPNIQARRIKGVQTRICTRCLKTRTKLSATNNFPLSRGKHKVS